MEVLAEEAEPCTRTHRAAGEEEKKKNRGGTKKKIFSFIVCRRVRNLEASVTLTALWL